MAREERRARPHGPLRTYRGHRGDLHEARSDFARDRARSCTRADCLRIEILRRLREPARLLSGRPGQRARPPSNAERSDRMELRPAGRLRGTAVPPAFGLQRRGHTHCRRTGLRGRPVARPAFGPRRAGPPQPGRGSDTRGPSLGTACSERSASSPSIGCRRAARPNHSTSTRRVVCIAARIDRPDRAHAVECRRRRGSRDRQHRVRTRVGDKFAVSGRPADLRPGLARLAPKPPAAPGPCMDRAHARTGESESGFPYNPDAGARGPRRAGVLARRSHGSRSGIASDGAGARPGASERGGRRAPGSVVRPPQSRRRRPVTRRTPGGANRLRGDR